MVPAAEAPAAPAPPGEEAEESVPAFICPMCHWDSQQPLPTPTPEERRRFQISMLGGVPFEREVSLYDGGLRVRFRTMLTDDLAELRKQITADFQDGKIGSQEILQQMTGNYQLLSCISAYQVTGQPQATLTGVHTHKIPDDAITALPALDGYLNQHLFRHNEPVYRAIQHHFVHFQQFVNKLENDSRDPSF